MKKYIKTQKDVNQINLIDITGKENLVVETGFSAKHTNDDDSKDFKVYFDFSELSLAELLEHATRQVRVDFQNNGLRSLERDKFYDFPNKHTHIVKEMNRKVGKSDLDKATEITGKMSETERKEFIKKQMEQLGVDSIDDL